MDRPGFDGGFNFSEDEAMKEKNHKPLFTRNSGAGGSHGA
jgi:hypothetical protein